MPSSPSPSRTRSRTTTSRRSPSPDQPRPGGRLRLSLSRTGSSREGTGTSNTPPSYRSSPSAPVAGPESWFWRPMYPFDQASGWRWRALDPGFVPFQTRDRAHRRPQRGHLVLRRSSRPSGYATAASIGGPLAALSRPPRISRVFAPGKTTARTVILVSHWGHAKASASKTLARRSAQWKHPEPGTRWGSLGDRRAPRHFLFGGWAPGSSRSSGLLVWRSTSGRTGQTLVVSSFWCPRSVWMVRRSTPSSSSPAGGGGDDRSASPPSVEPPCHASRGGAPARTGRRRAGGPRPLRPGGPSRTASGRRCGGGGSERRG